MGLHGLDHRSHRRHALGRRREDVGAIVLIAEHDRVDSARLQGLDVLDYAFDQPVETALGVVERRAGQGADVRHSDHDFRLVAQEFENHERSPQARTPLDCTREAPNLTSVPT